MYISIYLSIYLSLSLSIYIYIYTYIYIQINYIYIYIICLYCRIKPNRLGLDFALILARQLPCQFWQRALLENLTF